MFRWNDIMDPNFIYTTDQAKAEVAKSIPWADPQNYILSITWESKYNENATFADNVKGLFDNKSNGWPYEN